MAIEIANCDRTGVFPRCRADKSLILFAGDAGLIEGRLDRQRR